MLKTKKLLAVCLWSALAMGASATFAKVTPEEAAKLGKELTPMGAEKAGNADGTIPAWTGKVLGAPEGVVYKGTGTHYPDPYADEEPLFVITAGNMDEYADKLTDGLKALLKKYPNTFRIPVYPSHRDSRYAEAVHANTLINATSAELVKTDKGGKVQVGVSGAYGGAPFPIPKTGEEVMFNHNLHLQHYSSEGTFMQAVVYPSGNVAFNRYIDVARAPYYDPEWNHETFADVDLIAYFLKQTLEPVREKGEIVLVHEFLNQAVHPRKAWKYLPGTRRVRMAPTVGYDNPSGVGGLRTDDERQGFNGALDRYNWTIVGKKEMFIPYNNYKYEDTSLKYKDDILHAGHPNPDQYRFELHRVWIVEANLRDDSRHVYGKRRFYIDEDSWAVHLTDNYDGKDNLWRTGVVNSLNAYDIPGITNRVEITFDLQNGAYVIDRLYNEEAKGVTLLTPPKKAKYFTPANLRRVGRR